MTHCYDLLQAELSLDVRLEMSAEVAAQDPQMAGRAEVVVRPFENFLERGEESAAEARETALADREGALVRGVDQDSAGGERAGGGGRTPYGAIHPEVRRPVQAMIGLHGPGRAEPVRARAPLG